jgi:2-polyprenyl-3-methyl-5-hydroxy-6-metoxy-1,4-benzoquinol methylase
MQTSAKPRSAREFYDTIYSEKKPAQHEWVAGTASPELVKLVWDGTLKPGMRVLEVGCGVGTESVFMAIRGMNVSAVDLSENAIALSKQLAAFYGVNADFQQGDATKLTFPEQTFDAVCDQGVFHHLKDEERDVYAKELARVLKPGGLLVLRCFSDKIPGGPQPRRITSDELTQTFLPYLKLEQLERVLSFSTSQREKPLGWFSLWQKR